MVRGSRRSAAVLRIALLIGVVATTCHLRLSARVFTVKGEWSADLPDASSKLPAGLGPVSVSGTFLNTNTSTGGRVGMEIKAGRLVTKYTDGPFTLAFDDGSNWMANYSDGKSRFRMRGSSSGPVAWDIQKKGEVEGLGNVVVNMSSPDVPQPAFGVSVARDLPQVAGVNLKGFVSARDQALQGRLEAERSIGKGRLLKYSVENPEGQYELDSLSHRVAFKAALVDRGDVTIKFAREASLNKYNVTYNTGKISAFGGEASAVVGADNAGGTKYQTYGRVETSKDIGYGVGVKSLVTGRADDEGFTINEAVKLVHDAGSVELGYVLAQENNTMQLSAPTLTLNVTGRKDLTSALQKLDKSGKSSGNVVVTIDGVNKEGISGKLAASRALPKDFVGEVSLSARGSSVTPAVKVSNRFGSAEISKAPEAPPRLKLGYKFTVD